MDTTKSDPHFSHYLSVPIRLVLGCSSVLLLFLSATFGFMFLLMPFTVLLPFSLHSYQCITNFMIATWLVLPPILNQVCFGTRLRIFGSRECMKKFPCGVPEEGWNLFIMNHRTRLDWFYMWLTFLRAENALKMSRFFKIVLKSSLKNLPGFGWSMQMTRFLFLQRSWDKDKVKIYDFVDCIKANACPHSFLIFPEGTDFEVNSVRSSDSFARKNNLPSYKHVLHPRVTGTVYMMQQLIRVNSLERVVNITVKYPDFIPTNEFSLLFGRAPREIWYFVQILPLSQVPHLNTDGVGDEGDVGGCFDETKTTKWLQQLWQQKEHLLATIDDESSVSNSDSSSIQPKSPLRSTLKNDFVEYEQRSQSSIFTCFILIGWILFSGLSLYVLYLSRVVQLYCFTIAAVTIFISYKYQGWNSLESEMHKKQQVKHKQI